MTQPLSKARTILQLACVAAVSLAFAACGSGQASGETGAFARPENVAARAPLERAGVPFGVCSGPKFGSATSFPTGAEPSQVTTADFDGDGHLDVAVTNAGTMVSVLLGHGDGTFGAPVSYPVGGKSPFGTVSADFNGDGAADVAVADWDGVVQVLLGDGKGGLAT